MSDSLQRYVDARDRAYSEQRVLDRIRRNSGVARRVCRNCWHVALPRKLDPGTIQCPKCSGKLEDVVL